MPAIEVVFYSDGEGGAPAYDGLIELLRKGRRKEFAKCWVRIDRLAEHGFNLRRPEVEYLRDEVYELRVIHRSVHFRILYFFFRRRTVVLSHLITKEGTVPDREIDRAILHRLRFENDPEKHTFRI